MQSPLDELLWERSERLQEATARLAAALTAGDVSTVLLAITEEILEASAGVVYLVGADGTLELRASRGLRSAERWRTLPIDAPIPLAAAIASRTPLFFKSYADLIERYPHLAGSQTPASDLQAVAALPLMHASRLLGGFAVSFTKERSFNEHERRWLERIAAQAALAADRGRLYEAEKQAREKAEALAIDNAMLYRSARGAADAQQQLAETLAETVRLNEIFTGVLAHDLRAPLAAVLTSAGMLEIRAKRAADEPSMRAVGRIVGSGERMSRMIDQILDFTRARVGGSMAVDPRPADLKTITRQVIDELEQAHPDCHVDLSIEGSSDGTWDGDRLSQVFSNLIGNAIEHSPSGSPVRVAVDGGNPETLRVTVHNRGVIPGDLLSKLFEPFTAGEQRRGKSRVSASASTSPGT